MKPGLALLAALLAIASGASPALAQYRIGMSAAITGPASSTYAPTYEAYKVYFKRVNDAGGINGQKVEIAYEDDRGEPQRTAANAKKLAEGSILLVNASTSATYKPFMTESETEKIPLMFGGGVCPREAFPPASRADLLLDVVRLEVGQPLRARLHQGAGGREEGEGRLRRAGHSALADRARVRRAAREEMGLETIPVVVVPGNTPDFTPFAQKLKDAGADWVLSWAPVARRGRRVRGAPAHRLAGSYLPLRPPAERRTSSRA